MGRNSAWLALLLLWLAPVIAWAHSAEPRWFSGVLATEPTGMEDVRVVRETLTIDLRPLADHGAAKVTARYLVENPGPRRVDLDFTGGASIEALRVRLDGAPLATRIVPVDPPESGPLAPDVPTLAGTRTQYLADWPTELPAVSFDLPPGEHEIVVEYEGRAPRRLTCAPTICWQFEYLLAPASGFGGLDATILVPEAWNVAIAPTFEREGDVLHARFDAVPTGAIGLTLQAPASGMRTPVVVGTWVLFTSALLGGAWGCLRAGRSWGATQRGIRALVALFAAIAWPFSIFYFGLASVSWPRMLVPESQLPMSGIEDLWAVLVAFVAVPVGIAVVLLGWWRARSHARARA